MSHVNVSDMAITDIFIEHFHTPGDTIPTVVVDANGRLLAMGIKDKPPCFLVERLAGHPAPVVMTLPNKISDQGIKCIISVVAKMNESGSFSLEEGGARLHDLFLAMRIGEGRDPNAGTPWDGLPGEALVKRAHGVSE